MESRYSWPVLIMQYPRNLLNQPVQQRLHHGITAIQLVAIDKLVRLVRLVDRARPTNNAGNSQPLAEKAPFTAESPLDSLMLTGQRSHQGHDFGVRWCIQRRILIRHLDLDPDIHVISLDRSGDSGCVSAHPRHD